MITLRPYQAAGANWMQNLPFALLLDEPRVGKTFTALAAAMQAGADSLAVLGPAIAREVWRRSAKEIGYTGTLYVESYDKLVRSKDVRDHIKALKPDVLINDECHFLKSPDSKRTQYVYGSRKLVGLKEYAGAVWGLTGTLIPNDLGEAWTHLYAAGRTQRAYVPFKYRYCSGFETPYGFKVNGVRDENLDEFLGLLQPISLRRKFRDLWPELPRMQWNVEPLPGASGAIRALRKMEKELKLDKLGAALDKATPDEAQRLMDDCLNTVEYQRLVSEVKRPLVVDLARSLLDSGVEKLVIFGWFRETVEYIHEALRKDYGAVMMYGGTSEAERWARIDRFTSDPDCRVVVGNIRTMGTAVPLDAARHAILADSSWSMGDIIQAGKRILSAERMDPAEIIVASLAGTTDDSVARAHVTKAEQAGVLNALEG